MKMRMMLSGALGLCLGAMTMGCGAAPLEDDRGHEAVGKVDLALKGLGSLGGQYQLLNATFTITGTTNKTVSGDTDVVTESLPPGVYSVKLEPGWTLKKIAGMTTTDVSAVLASANPQPFVINGAQTTQVSWLFNVSGPGSDEDDLEIVAVSNSPLSLLLAAGESGWVNFAAGTSHTCGIMKNGQLKCWGSNSYGELGYGDSTARTSPAPTVVNVGAGRTVRRVVAARGGAFSCALLDDATVKCWGNNSSGQLGYADTSYRSSPPEPVVNLGSSNTAKTIQVGSDHTCVILDSNAVKCWGANNYGQTGYGDTYARTSPAATPVNLGPGNVAKSIVLGANHTCALLSTNQVKCWGANGNGQLGYGDSSTRTSPPDATINLGLGRSAKRLAAGLNHTCALLDNDTIKCWGLNSNGQLGYGDTSSRTSPPDAIVNLGAGRAAKRVVAGASHTCALLDDDTIKCWGINSSGQLGYEDTNQRSAPPALTVSLGTGRVARRLLADTDHSCVILADNGLKCWGVNTSGSFGLGTSGEVHGDQPSEMGDNLPEVLP
jgi:alpha-tubulin suppressor-like RCC1 family protein